LELLRQNDSNALSFSEMSMISFDRMSYLELVLALFKCSPDVVCCPQTQGI
jgi:hypothetical protein